MDNIAFVEATLNLYKRKKKVPVVAAIGSSPDSENDVKLLKKRHKQSEDCIVTRSHSSSGCKSAVDSNMCSTSSQHPLPPRFLIPLVKKLSQSDIEDFSSSLSCSLHSDETVLQSPVRDVGSSSQEESSLAQIGAFESQEEQSCSFSSNAPLRRVFSQKPPCLKFPGKEKCTFYQNSSFKYSVCDHPYCRAGDEVMLERFPGHGYSDSVDALSYLAFMSPPQSPPTLNGWSPIKASILMDDVSELDILNVTNESTRQVNAEPARVAKRVRFSFNLDNLDEAVADDMYLDNHSAKRVPLCDDDDDDDDGEMTTVQLKKSSSSCEIWTPLKSPPTPAQLLESAGHHGIPSCRHQAAYYSCEKDVVAAKYNT